MSEKKKYTAEDIRQYLEGGMSPAEMHALEREAISDPFLADAIEGMGTYDDKGKFFAEAEQLRERLHKRVTKRAKVLTVPIAWKVAAVLLIVTSGVALIVYMSQENSIAHSEIAKTERSQPARQKPATPQASAVADSPVKAPRAAELSSRKQSKKEEQSLAPASPDTPTPRQQAVAFNQSAIAEHENAAPEKQQKSDTDSIGVSGIKDHEALEEVVVVAYGMQKSKRSLGYSTKAKNADIASGSLRKRIEPQGGWEAFENYFSAGQSKSQIDTTRKGVEKISFIVSQAGRPSSIRILKSVSPAHDKEVTRLINEGPAWQVIRGKKRKVTLSIIF